MSHGGGGVCWRMSGRAIRLRRGMRRCGMFRRSVALSMIVRRAVAMKIERIGRMLFASREREKRESENGEGEASHRAPQATNKEGTV